MPETPSVLILHGNDELAITAHIDKACASLGDPSSAEMNIARFDGRAGLNQEAFHTAVNAAPFLAPRRVVVLLHPAAAFGGTPEGRERLFKMLEKVPPTTSIFLVEFADLCDPKGDHKKDHWLAKWVDSTGGCVGLRLYAMPKHQEMPRWIESEARQQGGRIDPDAAARLAEMTGEDTRMAAQELAKLLTYVNFERPIRLLDVENVSIVSAQASVFELVDALGQGDGKKAQKVLHRMLEDADPAEFWGMIIRQFRLLLQAREMLDEHLGVPDVQKTLGLHPFVANKICGQAGRFRIATLEAVYHKLLEIDEGAKTSRVPLDVSLDTLIVGLAHRQ
jgi:DNA polymerase-3 subunit delta